MEDTYPAMNPNLQFIDTLPISADEKRRVAMTASCHDADYIPKVDGAGRVVDARTRRCQIMHNGVRVLEDCYYGRWMTELIRLLRGHHEPQEEKIFYELLRHVPPGSTMVELGSFWSYYSLWFQQAIAGARNFMIEPDPHNLAVGQKNFELNGRQGKFFNALVGREPSPGETFVCESDLVARQIPCLSIDSFFPEQRIEKAELLLVDTQGAELAALEGAARSIAEGKLRFVIISTHHHSISHDPIIHQRCLQFLCDQGAYILAEHSVSESYSGDGLIAASFEPTDRAIPPIAISRNTAANSLFRETEYDLAEAYEKLARLEQTAAELSARTQHLNDAIQRLGSDSGASAQEIATVRAEAQALRTGAATLQDSATQNLADSAHGRYVRSLYHVVLGREPEAEGMDYWVRFIHETGDPTEVLARMLESEEYRARNSQQTTRPEAGKMTALAAHLAPGRVLNIVDVGAQLLSYQEHAYQPLLASGIPCHVIGFDPLVDRLSERASQEQMYDLTLLPYAIGDGNQHTLHINNDDGTSSLYPLNQEVISRFGAMLSLHTVRTEPVPTRTLDDVLTCDQVDFLKLDIQGFELRALEAARQTLSRTAVVHCEVEFVPIYQGQPLFAEVQTFLAQQGFQFVDIINPVRLPLIVKSGRSHPDTLIFADAVFFRRGTPGDVELRIVQALIASQVYGKHGLAEWLLQQCDADNGTRLAQVLSGQAE